MDNLAYDLLNRMKQSIDDEFFEDENNVHDYVNYIIHDLYKWDEEQCRKNYGFLKLGLSHNVYYRYNFREVMNMAFGKK